MAAPDTARENLVQRLLDDADEDDEDQLNGEEEEEEVSEVTVVEGGEGGDGVGECGGGEGDEGSSPPYEVFTVRGELASIWALGWPMGISYFCRMAMASTDSIFVGHYAGGHHKPGDYLAASALSDMVTTLLVVPPLAFNQVLNALCGQAARPH